MNTITTTIAILLCIALVGIIYILYDFWQRIRKSSSRLDKWPGGSNIPGPGGSVGRRIELDQALGIIRNYEERRKRHKDLLSEDQQEHGDSKSVFVDIKGFYSYLRYLDTAAEERGIRINGLRFYFGAYDHDFAKDKNGLQTLVIFPTVYDHDKGVDFQAIDLQSSLGTKLVRIHEELKDPDSLKHNRPVAKGFELPGGGSSGYNDMGSSPPRQPTG